MRLWLRLLLVCVTLLATASVRAQPPVPEADPHRRCTDLCAQLYAQEAEKLALCEAGCSTARDCMGRCGERFPDDGDKAARCTARCARR
jgi:hypothetical protein